jgi:hypothetical protein
MTPIRMLGAILAAATSLFAQLSAGSAAWGGLELSFVSKIEPDGILLPGGVVVGAGSVHHGISDNVHKREFGYDVVVEPNPGLESAQIRIERSLVRGRPHEEGWTFLELPKYPVISNVKVGDTVALDLLVNPGTGQRIVDYLTLRRHGDMDLRHEARDFRLSDVELTVLSPRLFHDGKPLPDMGSGGVTGAVIWVYISGHGRFVLSLLPNEKLGFRRGGVVSQNGLLFHDGASEYRLDCQTRIAPASENFNLYVAHEPDWRPGQSDPWRIGSADKPEFVVGRK